VPVRVGQEVQALSRATGLAASAAAAAPGIDRRRVRLAYRPEEERVALERIDQARLSPSQLGEATSLARALVKGVRSHKPSGLDAFLHAYDLGSDEGIALMCLAEALLRIPDAHTADELIADKLSGPDWADKLGESDSAFVNAATFSLLLTGKVLEGANDRSDNWRSALGRAVGRLGEPVVRTAVNQAMRILGRQFVFGRTIDEAMRRAEPERRDGLTHSFDMLGEAARTFADAERYADSYSRAVDRIAKEARGGFERSPGISVKLSALHPRYEWSHADEAKAYILPVLRGLAAKASAAGIHLTIDAEEADRLELQMNLFEALAADDSLFANGWGGLGIAIQAYQKRAEPLCRWTADLARAHGRRFMIRLVKGAYWDTEIKAAQVAGLTDYPVFTRKVGTDVSYLACAKVLFAASDVIYPAFATHNANTIGEVKADMESPRPMDRLICGDVGFGKTEVAVRAAFKAVMDGMQVAVLVPTTVLAQQHERTFRERLAAFPVRIEVLSRFRSDSEARAIVAALRAGEVDIVIGTHRLLQPGVEFANLGLVIIDEEQRFGVAHKERLKRMRLEVDVLSLSATPIPRTLHMSLTGIRDMSSIESAPVDRHPVQTFVAEWDPALAREAILRELDRGGQVYVVHNRVQSIDLLADRLRELVPHARIVVGHGQMSEVVLEQVMERFADAEYDVLVCTTIIESGIDIPNVNTLIVDNADQLGLAQLYQLRGRVGRSTQQAYAYLLHSRERILSEVAQQRLATIFEATELGAGFQVALRDLEIRGAGNLLGAEQSGQIASVGFDLYTQMLAEAVEEMKAKTSTALREEAPVAQPVAAVTRPARAVKIDLPVSAFIPESYVEEIEARLALYQRIAGLTSLADTEALRGETADRLGPLPEALDHLFALVRIRLAAAAADVASVRLEEGEVVVTAREDRPFGPRRLPSLPRAVRVGRTQLRLPRSGLGERWLEGIEALLRLVATGVVEPEREAVTAS